MTSLDGSSPKLLTALARAEWITCKRHTGLETLLLARRALNQPKSVLSTCPQHAAHSQYIAMVLLK